MSEYSSKNEGTRKEVEDRKKKEHEKKGYTASLGKVVPLPIRLMEREREYHGKQQQKISLLSILLLFVMTEDITSSS